MHSLHFAATTRDAAVQSSVFASRGPAEAFTVDAERQLSRTVRRRGTDEARTSEMGPLVGPANGDLRAAADLNWLRQKVTPQNPGGAAVRVVDLFSGCGAMSVGLREACRAVGLRFEPVAAYDMDEDALRVFAATLELPHQAPLDLSKALSGDIEAPLSSEEAALVKAAGQVDFLLAGPPCQGHSTLNNKTRHKDPKNELYFLVARYAKLTKPKWILIENVPAVRRDRAGVVQRTSEALEKLGYWVLEGVVDLWSIGVPQTRRRHVLVAQEGTSPTALNLDDLLTPYATRARPVAWAIEDLLDVDRTTFIDAMKVPDPVTQSRIDFLFDHDLFNLPDHMRPDCHRTKSHTYQSVYGRMSWQEPAPTITGGYDTMGRGRFVHPKRRRTITAHEAARLQFIPDFVDFSTIQERSSLGRLIGNAVPPKLSYVLGLELLR